MSLVARRVALRAGHRLAAPRAPSRVLPRLASAVPSFAAARPFHDAGNAPRHLPIKFSKYPMSTAAGPAEEEEEGDVAAPLFSSIESLHPSSLHAVEQKMQLTHMTEIQHKTFEAASTGQDILGRARTGTGKTLAFLLPAIESALRLGRVPGPLNPADANAGIAILIISPTRELAIQIHSQAQILAASHTNSGGGRRMASQVMYGGSSKLVDVQKLENNMPFILVATPGRLIDHMENSYVGGTSFSEVIGNVSVWVLDEADRCLDMGFRKDIEWILDVRKRFQEVARIEGREREYAERQTLLFSATLPKDLRAIMASHMRPDYLTIDCIHDVDPTTHTNASVDQSFVTLPDSSKNRWISGLVDIVEDIIHIQNPNDYKIVVFFQTTTMCQLFSNIFTYEYKIPVLEIHSKKQQSNRTLMSNKFRRWGRGILFTTDVSARGVDYPDVTHVIQHGSAENRETYIHRLGRTARAGKKGRGVLIMGSGGEERQFVKRELKGLDLKRDERFQRLLAGELVAEEGDGGGGINGARRRKEINDKRIENLRHCIGKGANPKLQKMASVAYRSQLGYNLSKMQNLGAQYKADVVDHVNSMAMQMGFDRDNMPRISPSIAQTLGLHGLRGINVGHDVLDGYAGSRFEGGRGRGRYRDDAGGRFGRGRNGGGRFRRGGGRFEDNRGGGDDPWGDPRGGSRGGGGQGYGRQQGERGRGRFEYDGDSGDEWGEGRFKDFDDGYTDGFGGGGYGRQGGGGGYGRQRGGRQQQRQQRFDPSQERFEQRWENE